MTSQSKDPAEFLIAKLQDRVEELEIEKQDLQSRIVDLENRLVFKDRQVQDLAEQLQAYDHQAELLHPRPLLTGRTVEMPHHTAPPRQVLPSSGGPLQVMPPPFLGSGNQTLPSSTDPYSGAMVQAIPGRHSPRPYRQSQTPQDSGRAQQHAQSSERQNYLIAPSAFPDPSPSLHEAGDSHGEYTKIFDEVAAFAQQWTVDVIMSGEDRPPGVLKQTFLSYTPFSFLRSSYKVPFLRRHLVTRYLSDKIADGVLGLSLYDNHPATDAQQRLNTIGRTLREGPPQEAHVLLGLTKEQEGLINEMMAHEGHGQWANDQSVRAGKPVLNQIKPLLVDSPDMRVAFFDLYFNAVRCALAL